MPQFWNDTEAQALRELGASPRFRQATPENQRSMLLERIPRLVKQPDILNGLLQVPAGGTRPSPELSTYQTLNKEMTELRGKAGRGIRRGLMGGRERPEMSLGAGVVSELVNPVPGSVPEAALMGALGGLSRVPMAGGRTAQVLKQTGRGALTGAGIYGAEAAVTGRDPLSAATTGAAAGGLGGSLMGIGSALRQSGFHAHGAREALKKFKSQPGFSPSVTNALEENRLVSLFEEGTVRKMQKAASGEIQDVMDRVIAQVGGDKVITIPSMARPPYGARVGQPPAVRSGDPGFAPEMPDAKISEVQRMVGDLRRAGNDREAFELEQDLIRGIQLHARALGKVGLPQHLADQYYAATAQYFRNASLIREMEKLQGIRETPGGANPVDFPGLAKGSRAMGDYRVGPSSVPVADVLMGAGHPASTWGAGHLARGLTGLGRRQVDPLKIGSPMDVPWPKTGVIPSALGLEAPAATGDVAREALRGR